MRIAIEVFGCQTESRLRGVGRYTHEFVEALLDLGTPHEFLLYAERGATSDYLPGSGRAEVRWLGPDAAKGERNLSDAVNRQLGMDPDRLDLLLLCNPSEYRPDYLPPSPPLNGVKMAVLFHDLIPLIFSEHYFGPASVPGEDRRYHRGLERIRRYDGFLTNSESTRQDVIRRLGVPADRVTNVRAGGDGSFFCPGPSSPDGLRRLGIEGPFVYSVGSIEYRKNLDGLIDAFASLPEPIRRSHRLVLTYNANRANAERIREQARRRGILDRLTLTGRLDDVTLRELYRGCAAFVFPSLYEGFGFPVLEAMLCGAPTIAGGNSSQVEIVGDAGLLVDAGSAEDIGRKLAAVLTDGTLAAKLRRDAPIQGGKFTWHRTAERAVEALEAIDTGRTRRFDRPRSRKPRIALFSPFPPQLSGISDYAVRLVDALKDHYAVDLYHDAGYTPRIKLHSPEFPCRDYRLFPAKAKTEGYRATVYQIGNSPLHRFAYDLLPQYPGLVTLHDVNLAAFRYWEAMEKRGGHLDFLAEVAEFDAGAAARFAPKLRRWDKEPGAVAKACARDGVYLNQQVFRHATGVVVHSAWALDWARRRHPDREDTFTLIPYGATAAPIDPAKRAAIRARYGLAADALVVGNFGQVHTSKMNVESLRAFGALAAIDPDARFLVVGPELDGGASRACAESLGLGARVRFLGPKAAEEFAEVVAVADIGLNLRRPPTNGETSSSLLDLLRHGVATLTTDVDAFADLPDHVVHKVPWGEGPVQERLTAALLGLAADPAARRRLGASAIDYIRGRHAWPAVAEAYVAAIEATLARAGTPAPRRLTIPETLR